MSCCNHQQVDLTLLSGVLNEYGDVKGSLITILQKTQEIYGYIPVDAVYHIAERTGATPAKIMGIYDRKGSLEKGKDADIICFDQNQQLTFVMQCGRVVKSA